MRRTMTLVIAILMAASAALLAHPQAAPAQSAAASFSVGSEVVVTANALNVRSGPGLGFNVSGVLQRSTPLTVVDGPVAADGFTWYAVQLRDTTRATAFTGNWVAGEFLALATPAPPPPSDGDGVLFLIGAEVVTTARLNVRSGPGLGFGVIGTLNRGTPLTVVSEGVRSGGFTWYQIQLRDTTTAAAFGGNWVAGEFLRLATPAPPPDDKVFPIGADVVVTAGQLNLRTGPGLGNATTGVVNFGARLTIVGGPVSANGFTWYEVQLADPRVPADRSGVWVAGEFLRYA